MDSGQRTNGTVIVTCLVMLALRVGDGLNWKQKLDLGFKMNIYPKSPKHLLMP